MNLAIDSQNQAVRISLMGMGYGTLNGLIFGIERVAVLGIGAKLVMDHAFSIGMLIAYLAYKEQFSGRISSLIDTFVGFKMLHLHAERLADIVLTEPEDVDVRSTDVSLVDTSIVVSDLSFRYADGDPWVLKNCSFRIESGEAVAVVGASGCGKTTLVKLLLGLLKPVKGSISIGGVDIHRVSLRGIRRFIGTVMQDDQLFAGSVADNVSFFDPAADRGRVESAAKLASVHDEILAMPMAYHGLIGDMGSTLSGGQKQRILLARALYRDPKLLFLDEATSHLDIAKENSVNAAIRGLQLTKVIVAHRPETIRSADRVLQVVDGEVRSVSCVPAG